MLLALALAAAPAAETLGSVDGPFLWVDARASLDVAGYESSSSYAPLAGQYAGGALALGQGQLVGGWGFRVLKQRLAVTASSAATGQLARPQPLEELHLPRFDIAPLLLSAAVPIPIDTVVLVPILGLTLPTRNSFNNDPVVSLQPQLRFRASFGAFTLGVNGLMNLPAITKWDYRGGENHLQIRCPPEETRCRMPVTREVWLAALSVQGEYWFTDSLSAGLRTKCEFREEHLGQLANFSGAADGQASYPAWSTLELQGSLLGSWAFSRFAGLSATFGLSWQSIPSSSLNRTGWNASLSVWFRTDPRLSRFWLDR